MPSLEAQVAELTARIQQLEQQRGISGHTIAITVAGIAYPSRLAFFHSIEQRFGVGASRASSWHYHKFLTFEQIEQRAAALQARPRRRA